MTTTTEAPPVYTLTPPRPSTSSSSSSTSLPAYSSLLDSRPFAPTTTLTILTPGKTLLSLPVPPAPIPIPIHDAASLSPTPKYLSLRAKRSSGTSTLVPGDDPSAPALATTTYRFGPGRPPSLTLHARAADPGGKKTDETDPDPEAFTTELAAPTFSRTTTLSTPAGRYSWRYPSRAERADLSHAARRLLLLERLPAAPPAEGSKDAAPGRLVGYLVRREGAASGEGGELHLDLASADEEAQAAILTGEKGDGYAADEKETRGGGGGEAREVFEQIAVASCLAMLKREIDRLRLRQGLIMGGAAGGC